MPYPLLEFGGAGPPIHIAIGNGFPPQTYHPLVAPLTDRFRVVSLPPRPLWPDPPPPESLASWRQMADDLLNGLREHSLSDVIAIGHSMGGVCSMLAVLAEPSRFRALILLDPTILPPAVLSMITVMGRLGLEARFPLVQRALHRRTRFADADEAFAYWRGKPLFRGWPDETLRLYVAGMTRPARDGDGLELAWSPEWEARVYRTVMTDVWREVPKLNGLLPTLVVRGSETNTFVAASARKMRRLLPGATYATVEGHGHLFPQTAPDEARRMIEQWLPGIL